MNKISSLFLILLFFSSSSIAQVPAASSGEILLNIKKLNTLGSVLYIAAHPDDENTRMITHFANEACMRAAYLSLTRGDGGQNLIGSEKAEKMGLIRTNELLEARKKDGGIQFFTRANDFGYSKIPDETLNIWDRDQVLSDVVWVIRKFRPDVIITRFSPASAGQTHGHHTTSAILAKEAYGLANNPKAFPEQLEFVKPWQPKRIFYNTSWWFYGTRDFDKTGLKSIDVGGYNPLLGKSYGEIAGASRSMHKSQGFGASETKGSIEEYLDPLDDKGTGDLFGGQTTDWSRVKNGAEIGRLVDACIKKFDSQKPYSSIPDLIAIRQVISKIEDDFWREIKLKETDDLIMQCLGFQAEALTQNYLAVPGDSMSFSLELINRSSVPVELKHIEVKKANFKNDSSYQLSNNDVFEKPIQILIPEDLPISQPYWLEMEGSNGMYKVNNQKLIGLPKTPPNMQVDLTINILGQEITTAIPFSYKTVDRVRGELIRDVVFSPAVTVNFLQPNAIFVGAEQKTIKIAIASAVDNQTCSIELDAPKGWKISPSKFDVQLGKSGVSLIKEISVSSNGKTQGLLELKAITSIEGKKMSYSKADINYEHIEPITYFPPSRMQLVALDLKIRGKKIGYVAGAGDEVPDALGQMGYEVVLLTEKDIIQQDLSVYDAILTGVRAFNTEVWLEGVHQKLMTYIEKGGHMIVQYNTNRGLEKIAMGPYPFQLSRDRVTVETATMKLLNPVHPIFNEPNKLTEADFNNWVQERGLYFADSWDPAFEALIEANDPGETPKTGMLITSKYGEGYFTYTGISFFRQLPAGVPGAFRLFANIIDLGK